VSRLLNRILSFLKSLCPHNPSHHLPLVRTGQGAFTRDLWPHDLEEPRPMSLTTDVDLRKIQIGRAHV
jgi:hypothetical protein